MKVKQVIVGVVLGMTAVASLLHRLPKQPSAVVKRNLKPELKTTSRATGVLPRKDSKDRFSLNKIYG